jgi:Na+-driven multidrug efflux pump
MNLNNFGFSFDCNIYLSKKKGKKNKQKTNKKTASGIHLTLIYVFRITIAGHFPKPITLAWILNKIGPFVNFQNTLVNIKT